MTDEEFEGIRGKLCPLCLRPRDEDGGCADCGWNGDVVRTRPNCLSPGTILRDRYLVGQPLGQGGFSVTYLVLDLSLNLRLCLKEYFPSSAVNRIQGGQGIRVIEGQMEEAFREGLEQFLTEGRILARLSGKPGIIEVRDLFQMNGTAYMVTDLLDGVNLRSYLEGKEEPLSPEQVLKILMPVMDSLRAVHDEGIIHRDISPENIFLTTDGQVRLLDFGSARNIHLRLAEGQSIVVKPGYAAPEQYRARGRQGVWTDVYGLAATFFRCVAGVPPTDALDRLEDDPLRTLFQKVRPPLQGKLKKALLRGMAVQVGDRFQDISSFQFALVHAVGLEEERPSAGDGAGRPFLKILAAAVLLAAVGSGAFWYTSGRPGKLLEKADRLIRSGQGAQAMKLLDRAEPKVLDGPGGEEILDLCRAYYAAGSAEKALSLVLRFPDRFGSSPDSLVCAARVLDATGRGERALEYVSRATSQDPDREDYWILQGRIALSQGSAAGALFAYEKAAETSPSDPVPRLESARILTGLSRWEQSEKKYVEALTLAPENGEAWEELALLRERRGNTVEAGRAWQRVVRFMPDRWSPWAHLGNALEASGDFSGASKAYAEAARLAPERSAVWGALGIALARAGSPDEALEAMDRATDLDPGEGGIELVSERGLAALEAGRNDRAVADLERVLSEDPSRKDGWKHLARAYEALGDYPGAAKTWERGLPYLEEAGEVHAERGRVLLLSGRPLLAEEAFVQALSLLDAPPAGVLLGNASALMAQARSEEAVPFIRQALDLEGDSPSAHLLLGKALLEEEGYAESVLHLLEARRLGNESAGLLIDLGRGYLGLDQYGKAVEYLREVLRTEPDNERAIRFLEQAFYRWGQHSGAVEAYGRMALEGTAEVRTHAPSGEEEEAVRNPEESPTTGAESADRRKDQEAER